MDSNCLFCKIIASDVPARTIYEDAKTLAFLDIRPVNPGHALVVPKQHFPDIYSLPAEDLQALAETAQKVAIALKKSGAEGVNLIMNNGSVADQVIFHAHLHIVPRFKGDGREPWHGAPEEEASLAKRAESLRTILSS